MAESFEFMEVPPGGVVALRGGAVGMASGQQSTLLLERSGAPGSGIGLKVVPKMNP
jgi:hypothetical protein